MCRLSNYCIGFFITKYHNYISLHFNYSKDIYFNIAQSRMERCKEKVLQNQYFAYSEKNITNISSTAQDHT